MAEQTLSDRPWVIYALRDPRDGRVRYVGWTVNQRCRLRDHTKPSAIAKKTRKARWLARLLAEGKRPDMVVLETGGGEGWQEAEVKWIAHFRSLAADLTNVTNGGDGTPGRRHSAEARAAMSQKRKGVVPTAEARAKMSEARRGKTLSPKGREALRAALLGKTKTAEHRKAISEARRGKSYPLSDERRERLAEANRARAAAGLGRMSQEARERLSIQRKGKRATHIQQYWASLSGEERSKRNRRTYHASKSRNVIRDLFE